MDRRDVFRPADDGQVHRLVGVTPEAANLKVSKARIERVAEHGGRAEPAPCSRACGNSRPRRRGRQLRGVPWGLLRVYADRAAVQRIA